MYKNNLCILAIVVSLLIGVFTGVLFFNGTIVTGLLNIPVVIGLIFSGITLILLYITTSFDTRKEIKECIYDYGKGLILGGLLTIVTGILILTLITLLVAGSISMAILIGAFGFAFILNFLSFAEILICLFNEFCRRKKTYCKDGKDYNIN